MPGRGDPVAVRAARATADLGVALRAGVTSVREAGGLVIHLAAAVAEGSVPGPRVYAAGAALSVTGGHADLHALPIDWVRDLSRWEPSVRVCDGMVDVVAAVREQLRAGAEVIKTCASGGVISERNDPQHQQFTSGGMAAIVEVAGLADRSVMTHCYGVAARLAAVEVASSMTPEMALKMADVYADSGERIARAHACGIRIAMGTDARRGGARGPGRDHPCPAGG